MQCTAALRYCSISHQRRCQIQIPLVKFEQEYRQKHAHLRELTMLRCIRCTREIFFHFRANHAEPRLNFSAWTDWSRKSGLDHTIKKRISEHRNANRSGGDSNLAYNHTLVISFGPLADAAAAAAIVDGSTSCANAEPERNSGAAAAILGSCWQISFMASV
jgi:hypothetical protein